MLTKADKLLIVLVIALFFTSIWLIKNSFAAGNFVSVIHSGKTIENIPLNKDKIIPVKLDKATMKIEIKDRRVRVLESNCKHGLCAHAGWIKNNNEVIACVPNKLILEIKSIENRICDAVCR